MECPNCNRYAVTLVTDKYCPRCIAEAMIALAEAVQESKAQVDKLADRLHAMSSLVGVLLARADGKRIEITAAEYDLLPPRFTIMTWQDPIADSRIYQLEGNSTRYDA